ncbi:MAG: DUF4360 domain-containing protein [Pseudomonadota bacterium]|nr:DUF4360 domain-containing protein [Pseudomonadota bacterium]
MKNKILGLTSIAFIILAMEAPTAAQGVDIDAIATAGTGCTEGTVNKKIEVLPGGALKIDLDFSEYNVLVGFGKTLDRKNCAVALPISLDTNQRLKVARIILRTDGVLAAGSKTALRAEVFTAGEQGQIFEREILPDQELQGRFTLRGKDVLGTECGVDTNLRVNTSILINSQETGRESGLSAASMTLILVGESCT